MLNRLKDFKATILDKVDELAVVSLNSKIDSILNSIADAVENCYLTDEEENRLVDSLYAGTYKELIPELQQTIRERLYDQAFRPVLREIHQLRITALFLNKVNYSNYLIKSSALYDGFAQAAGQLSVGLIQEVVNTTAQAKKDFDEAQKEFKTTGSIISE